MADTDNKSSSAITPSRSAAEELRAARDKLYSDMAGDPTASIPWSVHIFLDRLNENLDGHNPDVLKTGAGMERAMGQPNDGRLMQRIGSFLALNAGKTFRYGEVFGNFSEESATYVKNCLAALKRGDPGLPEEKDVVYKASGGRGMITVVKTSAQELGADLPLQNNGPKPQSKTSSIITFLHGHPSTTRDELLAGIGLDPSDKKERTRLTVAISAMRSKELVERGAYKLTAKGDAEAVRLENKPEGTQHPGEPLLPRLRQYLQGNVGRDIVYDEVVASFPDYRKRTVEDYLRRFAGGEFVVDGYDVKNVGKGKIRVEKPAAAQDDAAHPLPVHPVAAPAAHADAVQINGSATYAAVVSSIDEVYVECPALADLVGPRKGLEPNMLKARQNMTPATAGIFYQALQKLPGEGDYMGRAHNDFLRLAGNDRTAAGRFMDWVLNNNGLTSEVVYAELGKYGSAISKRA